MKANQIKCPTCHGSGKADLAPHLEATLKCFRSGSAKLKLTSEQVYEKIGNGETRGAIYNRLFDLAKLGFLSRVRAGKFYQFFLAAK